MNQFIFRSELTVMFPGTRCLSSVCLMIVQRFIPAPPPVSNTVKRLFIIYGSHRMKPLPLK